MPILASLLLLAPDVLDVDAQNGPYFEIRDAVAAAQDGDVVRVAPGTYGWFGVFGKSLTVASSVPGASVDVVGSVRVQSLDAADRVVLAGLSIERDPMNGDDPIIVAANAGSVRIQDCYVHGGTYIGVRVQDSVDVTLEGTEVVAGSLWSTFFGGAWSANAVEAYDSTVTVWHSTLTGSDASVWGVQGGHGLFGYRSDVYVHGVTATGGMGGPDDYQAFTGMCREAGDGGHGVQVVEGALRILDCSLTPGPAGTAFECNGFGTDGLPYSTHLSTLDLYGGGALALECDTLAQESSAYTIDAAGDPGDVIVLVFGPDTDRVALPAYTGDLHVGGPIGGARRTMLGVGSVQVQLQLPPLPALTTSSAWLQTVHLRGSEVVFGPTRSLTILDSAW